MGAWTFAPKLFLGWLSDGNAPRFVFPGTKMSPAQAVPAVPGGKDGSEDRRLLSVGSGPFGHQSMSALAHPEIMVGFALGGGVLGRDVAVA